MSSFYVTSAYATATPLLPASECPSTDVCTSSYPPTECFVAPCTSYPTDSAGWVGAGVGSIIVGLLLMGAIIYGFVWLITHLSNSQSAKDPNTTHDGFSRVAVGIAIALLLPTAINLLAYSFDKSQTSVWSLLFILIVSIATFVGGMSARRNQVISIAVMAGSIVSIVYAVLGRYDQFPDLGKALAELGALAALTGLAYWLQMRKDKPMWNGSVLRGFNGFLWSVVIFVLAWALSYHVAAIFDSNFSAGVDALKSSAGIVYLVVFVIELVVGVLLRRLEAVSRAYIAVGLIGALVTALPAVIDAGTTAAAIATTLVTALLVFIAYKRFTMTEEEHKRLMAMQVCANCGYKNEGEAKFCTHCGKSLKKESHE